MGWRRRPIRMSPAMMAAQPRHNEMYAHASTLSHTGIMTPLYPAARPGLTGRADQGGDMAEQTPDPKRFLEGSFAPVSEEITAFDLPVTGQVPAELTGRYLRNGPNPMGLDDPDYHWFLGSGMVHGVRLRDGRAEWYRNRWVRSKAVAQARGEQWPGGPVHENMDFAANTHIISHGGRTLATVEAGPLPYELTYELDTVGPCNFGGTLPGGFAAHTKLDHETGELHAIAYFWAWDHVQHVIIDPAGQVTRTTDIPVSDGPMMHDFALTRDFVVLLDLPVTFSLKAVEAGRELPYVWNPDHQARVGLLPRDGSGEVRWFNLDPCWVFHCLNAYDDGGRVVVDLCQYSESFDVSTLWAAHGPVTLDRWIIDPAAGKVTQQRLDDRGQEFPRIDDRIISRPHRYGYSAGTSWRSSTTPTEAPLTWSSSPPRTSPPTLSPLCTCPRASRSASTATGSPTTDSAEHRL